MNKLLEKMIGRLLISVILITYLSGCDNASDVPPGLSVEISEIKTFPGDNVMLRGMASAVDGIEKIEITCANWNVDKMIDLSNHKPKIFNYSYTFTVPENAGNQFNESITIAIVDVDGNTTRKNIPVTFLADITPPVFNSKPASPVSVDFDVLALEGNYLLKLTLSDDRALSMLTITIPGINLNKNIILSGKTQSIEENITFLEAGTFEGNITVEDKTGNKAVFQVEFIVIPSEDEDAISDYAQMYIINAEETPDSYLLGYYIYMSRINAYQYRAKFYAAKDDTKVAFVPTQKITDDYFGLSPFVSTKLMNKNGYAVPINIAQKGYYTVDIDIQNKTYSIVSYTPAALSYTGALNITGVGFAFADWTMSPNMTQMEAGNDYRFTVDVGVVLSESQIVTFCFTNSSWSPQWKPDGNAGAPATAAQITGWSVRSAGGNFEDYLQGPGMYTVTFDLETLWATISAKH